MPIYEYTCGNCEGEFELLIRGSDQPVCPDCGGRQLQKQLSVPAAHSARTSQLPICERPVGGGCGLPQCGMGGCQLE